MELMEEFDGAPEGEQVLVDDVNRLLRAHERRLLLLLYFDKTALVYNAANVRKGMSDIYADTLGATSGRVLQKCFIKDELPDSEVIEALRVYMNALCNGLGEKYRYIIGRELGLNVN